MSDYFGHYSELCSVELWGVVSVQAKVEMYSKYERQKDKRSYDDRMHLFTGPQFVSPPDRIRPQVLARFCMRHPATHTHTHTHLGLHRRYDRSFLVIDESVHVCRVQFWSCRSGSNTHTHTRTHARTHARTHTRTHTPCVVCVRVSAPSPPWHFWSCSVLFCSSTVLDPRVGHTMDVLSPLIPALCHSD